MIQTSTLGHPRINQQVAATIAAYNDICELCYMPHTSNDQTLREPVILSKKNLIIQVKYFQSCVFWLLTKGPHEVLGWSANIGLSLPGTPFHNPSGHAAIFATSAGPITVLWQLPCAASHRVYYSVSV